MNDEPFDVTALTRLLIPISKDIYLWLERLILSIFAS